MAVELTKKPTWFPDDDPARHTDQALDVVRKFLAHLLALLGMIYALHVDDDAQHVAALTYAGDKIEDVIWPGGREWVDL